ncbi:uncharacterized protein LOC110178019 [Drosophila serrata]|uniref:uncharacterized protein LOC110178019 n=1 Tax=Drosophila serrata TaxID=7274 RepID=UPI000A1D01BE|nr:uncharacterized protein LOC110178019 [Drosophila serrata]
MENKIVRASSCPDLLLFTKQHLDVDKTIGAAGDGAGKVKLNANANEFVPRQYRNAEENDLKPLGKKYPNVYAQEFVPRQKKDATTQLNAGSNDDLFALEDDNEFPNMPIRVGHGSQVVLLNDKEYMIVPRVRAGKKKEKEKEKEQQRHETPLNNSGEIVSSTSLIESHPHEERLSKSERKRRAAEERRRDHDRQVALEAIMLTEQRRSRSPMIPDSNTDESTEPIIHLSHSPIRYSPKERSRVDRLRSAKRERIERVLREMSEERKQRLQKQKEMDSVSSAPTRSSSSPPELPAVQSVESPAKPEQARRYIPTAKEWDEHRRAKAQAKRESKRKARREAKREAKRNATVAQDSSMDTPSEGAMDVPLTSEEGDPPVNPPAGNHNVPSWTYQPNWPTKLPQIYRRGRRVLRYTNVELQQLKPKPQYLETICLEEKVRCLGCMYN